MAADVTRGQFLRLPHDYVRYGLDPDNYGVPLLKIVAPLSFLVMAFLVYDTLKYPALALSGDSSHRWYVPAFMLGTAAFGLVHVDRQRRLGGGREWGGLQPRETRVSGIASAPAEYRCTMTGAT